MPVRKTETRIPLGAAASDLGEASVAADGRCALVSFITSPLVVQRENTYVVFVTDAGLAAQAQSFEWSFSENGGTASTQTTQVGEAVYSPQGTGSLSITVRILDGSNAEQATLSLTQAMVLLHAGLEALIAAAKDQPGPGVSDPDVSRELVNDYNPYYQAVSLATPETGDAFKQFLFSMLFEGASRSTPGDRKQLIEDLAQALDGAAADDFVKMLTKQWQMGEIRGSDAGSPVFAKLLLATTRLTKYRPAGGAAQFFDSSIPLETKVERHPVPLHRQQRILALDLRLVMARQWFALIADVADYRDAFKAAYPIAKPDPSQEQDVDVCSHPEVWDTFQAVAGRAMDGGALLEYLLADPSHHAYDGLPGIAAADHAALDDRAQRFRAWASRFLTQPSSAADDAWVPDQLDYQFAASAPLPDGSEKVYVASDYSSGRLDWYSLDLDQSIATLGNVAGAQTTGFPPDEPFTTIPIPVSFSGMPNTRWWAFEDHATNFGDIDASTTDLAKLLFMEFALVYSNDWFVVPCTLPSGALAQVRGMSVTNVFGERLWIEAADQGAENAWGRWSMFTINVRNAAAGGSSADTTLVLLPTLARAQSGSMQEEVFLVRDEVADMTWGVERTVALASGISRPGSEVAKQTFNYLQSLIPGDGAPPPLAAAVRYQAMNSVPENWIPFIPVHVPNDNREIQLQRAAMPRILIGDPRAAQKVQPLTSLLRQGLDVTPARTFFLHEEEVPRAGARLTQYYSRARWTQGQVYTWLRVQKQTGRGEASSGLAFDQLVDKRVAE